MVRWFVGSILHGEHELFPFQPVFHDWYNIGRGMSYPVCGMMHIKKRKLSERMAHVAAAGFLSRYLYCPLPYVCRYITIN